MLVIDRLTLTGEIKNQDLMREGSISTEFWRLPGWLAETQITEKLSIFRNITHNLIFNLVQQKYNSKIPIYYSVN